MTAFENWLVENKKATLIYGGEGDFSTYTNLYRVWIVHPTDFSIQIGLFSVEGNTIVGLRFPTIRHLPTDEKDFIQFYHSLLICGVSEKFKGKKVGLYVKDDLIKFK